MNVFSRFREFCAKFLRSMKSPKGYIAIIMTAFIPLVLLGLRYFLDTRTLKNLNLYKRGDSTILFKKCAAEAALEVAKHWNPGLTMSQQGPSMYRIADKIYNESPTYHAGLMGGTIGAETDGISTAPSMKQIAMDTVTPEYARFNVKSAAYGDNLPLYALYSKVYNLPLDPKLTVLNYEPALSSGGPRQTIGGTTIHSSGVRITMPSEYVESGQYMNVNDGSVGGVNNVTSTRSGYDYLIRTNSDDLKLKIQALTGDDMIKVTTDTDVDEQYQDVGCAKPAYCNVDIILTIPTNMAASNPNNLDSNTPTAGAALTHTDATSLSDDYMSTPIYEIAGAYQGFLKHFMFTQGVGVGLIPYDANIGIPEARASDWTIAPPAFSVDNWPLSPYLRRAFLYGAHAGAFEFQSSSIATHHGPNAYSMNAIFSRAGETTTESLYGNNTLFKGDILSNDAPTSNFKKFIRQFCVPAQFINLLSMKSEVGQERLKLHPFHIAEITNNVDKIFNLLSVMGPHNGGRKNVSNFVFLPIVWANNLLQSWTADKYDNGWNHVTEDGFSDDALSTPSKSSSKHAVILLVNKPDFFKENELTYLGFSDDFSEVPMVESDKICFDTDYATDASKSFFDGTTFNGTIRGTKGILTYTTTNGNVEYDDNAGYYQADNGAAGKLTFPRKHLVKLVVAPKFAGENSGKHEIGAGQSITYTFKGTASNNGPILPGTDAFGHGRVTNGTQGPFGHNLSPYKVKYALENATITLCKLYGQVLRDYISQYGRKQLSVPQLILNNGMLAQRDATGDRPYSTQATFPDITSWSYKNPTVRAIFHLFMDPCVAVCNSPTMNGYIEYMDDVSYTIKGLPTKDDGNIGDLSFYVSSDCNNNNTLSINYHLTTTLGWGYSVAGNNNDNTSASFYWRKTEPMGEYSSPHVLTPGLIEITTSKDKRKLELYVLNGTTQDTVSKEFKSTDANINTNPFDNAGVYLLNNWICFNGDAKLEVTVTAGTGGGYVTFFDDNRVGATTASITVNGTTYSNITAEKEIYVEATNITQTEGSGNSLKYCIPLTNMQNIRLVSAEITNRAYTKKTPSVTLSGKNDGTGTAYLTTNVKKPITLKTNFEWPPTPRYSGAIDFTSFHMENTVKDGDLTYTTTSGTLSYDETWRCYKTAGAAASDSTCSATGKLSFPGGKLLKVVVEPAITWQNLGTVNFKSIANTEWFNMGRLGTTNHKIQAISRTGIVAESEDGITFTKVYDIATPSMRIFKFGLGLLEIRVGGPMISTSSGWFINGIYNIFINSAYTYDDSAFDCNDFRRIIGGQICCISPMTLPNASGVQEYTNTKHIWNQSSCLQANGICAVYSDPSSRHPKALWFADGSTSYTQWIKQSIMSYDYARILGYGNGRWIIGNASSVSYATNPSSWNSTNSSGWTAGDDSLSQIQNSVNEWYGGPFINDRFYAVNFYGRVTSSFDGTNWSLVTNGVSSDNSLGGTGYRNITYWKGNLWCYRQDGICYKGHFGKIKFNASSAGATSDQEYAVTGKKTFYIEVSQLNGSELTFNMTNIRLISAELIPNTYTKTIPTCSLSGTQNGTGTCTITTNVKQPMTLKVNSLIANNLQATHVPSYTDWIYSICYGGGKYVAAMAKFPPTMYVGTSLDSLSPSGVSGLENEYLVYKVLYGNGKFVILGSEFIIYGDGTSAWNYVTTSGYNWYSGCFANGKFVAVSTNGIATSTNGSSWSTYGYSNAHGLSVCYADGKYVMVGQQNDVRTSSTAASGSWSEGTTGVQKKLNSICYGNGTYVAVGDDGTILTSTNATSWTSRTSGTTNKLNSVCYTGGQFVAVGEKWTMLMSSDGTNWVKKDLGLANDGYDQLKEVNVVNEQLAVVGSSGYLITCPNSTSYISYYNPMHGKTIDNGYLDDQTITIDPYMYNYVKSGDNYTITLELKDAEVSDLQFIDDQGICEIVEEIPQTEPSRITYKAPDGTTNITQYPAAGETITIDPKTHYYEKINGGYRITLNVTSNEPTTATRLSDPALKDTSTVYEFNSLRVPEMSRYIDFRQNVANWPYISNSDLISLYGSAGIRWDNKVGGWVTRANYSSTISGYSNINWLQIPGNAYTIVDSQFTHKIKDHNYVYADIAGLFRKMWPFSDATRSFIDVYSAAIYPVKYEIAGWTLPINTMLYFGASGSALHNYQWQSDSTGDNIIQVDPHKACKQVTIDACNKLKTDYGNDMRVYVIKYRKQTQYREYPSGTEQNWDYSYIDNCASSNEYVYDVSTKAALEETLDDIADDIKTWANYKPAELVATDDIPASSGGFF